MYFKYNDKNIYYEEQGDGEKVLLFLHGNTASSMMFKEIVELYLDEYKIVLIDFLGSGKSDKVETLNKDLWFDEANQVITLLEKCNYKKVDIIGTSGGALVAINVALEKPKLVNKVIADSFEGEESLDIITSNIIEDRNNSKKDENAKMFYYMMNGEEWEIVVDADTKAIYEHSKDIKKFFHKDISKLNCPILFTGSKKDEFLSIIGENYYEDLFNKLISKVKNSKKYIFENGGHPAMLTSAKDFSKIAKEFLK